MPVSTKPRTTKVKWKRNVPKALAQGDHSVGDSWYSPTKGWRKIRKPVNHYLINTLTMPFGVFIQ